MAYSSTCDIRSDRRSVVVRFDRDVVDPDALSRFIDYVELESIRRRSKLTPEETDNLVREIDVAIWDKVRRAYNPS